MAVSRLSTDVHANSTTNTATFVVANSGSRAFTYDLNGNTTNDGLRGYEWDGANRLVKITYAGTGNYTQFTYDGLSRRVGIEEVESGSTVSDRRFVYDGLSIAEERNASNEVTKRFFPQGVSIFHSPSSSFHSFYYVRDHLGSIRAMVNEGGEERGRWSYSLWGARGANEITSDPVESDFGYTGHLEHERSGLVFAFYRAYDPELERWLSRDPIGEDGGINLYSYVSNNPVNLIDPDGLTPLSAWGAKAAVTVGIGVVNKLNFGAKMLGNTLGLNEVPNDYDAHRETSRQMCKYGDKGVAEALGNWAEWGPFYKEFDSELDQQANAAGREQGSAESPPWVGFLYSVIYWSPF